MFDTMYLCCFALCVLKNERFCMNKKMIRCFYMIVCVIFTNCLIPSSQDKDIINNFVLQQNVIEHDTPLESIKKNLKASNDFKKIAQLYKVDIQSLIDQYTPLTYSDQADDMGEIIHGIHEQVKRDYIENPLCQMLLDPAQQIDFSHNRYFIIGEQAVNNQNNDILNFVAQHKDFDFDVTPAVHAKSRRNNLTPLMIACRSGSMEMVSLLLHAGATDGINFVDKLGWTPLMYACENQAQNSQGIVKLLLKLGVGQGINLQNYDEESSSLLYACGNRSDHAIEVVRL